MKVLAALWMLKPPPPESQLIVRAPKPLKVVPVTCSVPWLKVSGDDDGAVASTRTAWCSLRVRALAGEAEKVCAMTAQHDQGNFQ